MSSKPMPIFWRYLLSSYLRTFSLAIFGFMAILLLTCFREIARLIAFGSSPSTIWLFAICQIPYFLPIAIPLSGLIASLFLMRRLSQNHELTSFRCAGLSLSTFNFPLLMIALVLSFSNLIIVSEITPCARLYSRNLLHQMMMLNPLALLTKSHPFKSHSSYIDMHTTHRGTVSRDVTLVVKNRKNERLSLLSAEQFRREQDQLIGENVAMISYLAPNKPRTSDHLIIDNQRLMVTSVRALSEIIHDAPFHFSYTYLPMGMLFKAMSSEVNPREINKMRSEFMRRLFFPLITYAFAFMGMSLGLKVGRRSHRRGPVLAFVWATITFICAIAAKPLRLYPMQAAMCYAFPLFPIIFCSFWFQRRIFRGIE